MKRWMSSSIFVLCFAATFLSGINSAYATACNPATSTSGGNTTLTFSQGAACDWTVPANVTNALTILIVGGGGGAGYYGNAGGGGAGAIVVTNNFPLTPGAVLSIVVGAGGAGSTAGAGTAGSSSSFNGVTAAGGGYGAGGDHSGHGTPVGDGGDGGSGGGGSSDSGYTTTNGGSSTASATSPWTAYGNIGSGGSGGTGGAGGGAGAAGSGGAGGGGKTFLGTLYSVGGYRSGGTSTPSEGTGNGGSVTPSGGKGSNGIVKIQFVTPPTNPVFSYSAASQSTSAGTPFPANAITSTGTTITSFSISPTLPNGVTLNSSTGALTGAPTQLISSVLFTITGTDAGSNTGTTTLTLTVTQGNSTVSVDGPTQVIYRTTSNETATVSALGKVTFYWNGKKIPGCQSLQASGSSTFTAVCQWKPALIGRGNLLAKLTPSTTAITGSSSSNFAVDVARRTTTR